MVFNAEMFLINKFIFAVYSLVAYLFVHYLSASYLINSYTDWVFNDNHVIPQLHDFIIVGAGSAGSILAAELSNGGNKVLLVEAGAEPAYLLDIPILSSILQRSHYDWQYVTQPQDNACKGLLHNQSMWPRGKVLGGSSRLNYMVYFPGHPKDYEEWFPDYTDYIFKDEDSNINEPRWHSYLTDAILNAMSEILPSISTDFQSVRLTTMNGERWSTDRLLKSTSKNSPGIITHGVVNKLIFDGDTAKGIEFSKWGNKYRTFAKHGVIISAGTIGSPKLLMLSGIGPKKHLESLGINVIHDLPVGQNLADHVFTGLDLITINGTTPLGIKDVLNPLSALNYLMFRQGPWTSSGIEAIGTFYTPNQNAESEAPALQLMIVPIGVSQDDGFVLRKSIGISDKIFGEYFAPLTSQSTLTIAPILLHPKSTGEIKLKSSNPDEDPIIDPKYLSHKDDVTTLISGIQIVKRILNTDAMKKIGASLYKKNFPGCENFVFDTIEYWECYIRHLTMTTYHPAGTCRMGDVVDASFRVFKTKNLYIVDASVFPTLPSGNTNAAVMMLAKKASRMLQKIVDRSKTCSKLDGYLIALYGEDTDIIYLKFH